MKETWVKEGQKVKQGEPMGIIGGLGVSTGIHLHWEIVYDPMVILQQSNLILQPATSIFKYLDQDPKNRK